MIKNIKDLYQELDKVTFNKNEIYLIIKKITGLSKEEVLDNLNKALSKIEIRNFKKILKRINKKEPIEYILKEKFFYKRFFKVNKNVLIPRNDSEQIVEIVLDFLKNKRNQKILDLCCGSGCLGLSVFFEKPNNNLFLSDISKKALKIAKINSDNNKDIDFIKSNFLNLFLKRKQKFNIIICNPPYIDINDIYLDEKVNIFEPKLALFAKDNGLFFYKELLKNIENIVEIESDFLIVLEFGWKQKDLIEDIIKISNIKYDYSFQKDFFGNWRYLIIQK